MPRQTFLTPDRLHDRPWRSPGHPFTRALSAKRRWIMLAIFALLCGVIGAYHYVTDARRVRALAETELSRLIGGTVTVGQAKLSLFEGLRLEYVSVYVDDKGEADSLVFSATNFLVDYDFKALLTGRLKLTQIVAVSPHVQLIENLDTGKWNYQRMRHRPATTTTPVKTGPVPTLPEIILRDAQVNYAEIRSGLQTSSGTLNIEGQFAPTSDGERYTFELQSRGGTVAPDNTFTVGPMVQGSLVRSTGQVTANLRGFKFGKDVRSMLPAEVKQWWDDHALSGGVNIPKFVYTPADEDSQATFEVQTQFDKVNLTVQPPEWMSRDELAALSGVENAFKTLSDVGLNSKGVVDRLFQLVRPSPIQLAEVEGSFTFTNDGIVLGEYEPDGRLTKPVRGVLEKNTFGIDGRIQGYSPQSPAHIRIAATRTNIPAQPRYITSMPPPVRELYDHLRPQGVCTISLALSRPKPGGRVDVSGGINILDGSFVFDKFPYPVRNATGQILFGYDDESGMDQVKLVDLQGKGVADGPNAESIIKLSGLIRPLTSDVGVFVKVSCDNVRDEPTLKAAFPEEVRTALRGLDADGKGEYPKFRGSFECRINRAIGPHSLWLIDTDVVLEDAAGKMVVFPYLMEHVTGRLEIREGYVDIIDATMKDKDASLVIGGRVLWRAGAGGARLEPGEIQDKIIPTRPDLKVTARNVPIDKKLLDALPEDRRVWIQKVGLTGILDIDGRVWRPSREHAPATPKAHGPTVGHGEHGAPSELTQSFDLRLRNGAIWPIDTTFTLSNVTGSMRLLPDRMIIHEMTAKRENATLTGKGEVAWPDNKPSVAFSGAATGLELDRNLYRMLPAPAKVAWDAVRPEGIVDLDISYRGAVGEARDSGLGPRVSQQAATAQSPDPDPETSDPLHSLDLILHPVKLSATVQAVPYRLDDITGTVRLSGGKVTLTDLVGKHDAGTVRISGSGLADKTDWDLRVSAEQIKIDDALRTALPPALKSLAESLKLGGTIGFEFPKLTIRNTPPDRAPTTRPATTSPTTPLDIDFAVKLNFTDSSLDIGVPLTKVQGALTLDGTVRAGKLDELKGPLDLATLMVANRPAQDLHAQFIKPAGQDAMRIGDITGTLTGGRLSGRVDLAFPETGDSRFLLDLTLRNADTKQFAALTETDVSGELSAYLALEGGWTDPRTRRGRGEVGVSGKEMYKIPLVLGLLQITNLSLPITSPFNEGSARYNVDGQTVTFESLQLKSRDMLMTGQGNLDFGTKQVNMTFTTDNPNWPKIPIIADLVQTAKNELFQIHVKGTLQDPKVSASAANTVTTTVDEVFSGDGKK